MLNSNFIHPNSIAIVGASTNVQKPGGKLTYNLINGRFKGELLLVNPHQTEIQGRKSCKLIVDIDKPVGLGIIAVPAALCLNAIRELYLQCNTRAFIIISAGFGEIGPDGKALEKELLQFATAHECQIMGPNCTGLITKVHSGTFTTPVPDFHTDGVTLVSASGATAVFLMEEGLESGLKFSQVFSVGNGVMIHLEDILEYLDNSFEHGKSSETILLYIEAIKDPEKFHRHALSLSKKGCHLAAIKSGTTSVGSRAAASHTGALANPDEAVNSLLRKSGIIRCDHRHELITTGQVLQQKPLNGKRMAVVTHAGGPGVLAADALSKAGFRLPKTSEKDASALLSALHSGSSVNNPFDILATATEKELSVVLDYIVQSGNFDGVLVIFGSPGLFDEKAIFRYLSDFIDQCKIPVYVVAPSVINTQTEIRYFKELGKQFFSDESILSATLGKILLTSRYPQGNYHPLKRSPAFSKKKDFLPFEEVTDLLTKSGIPVIKQKLVNSPDEGTDFYRKNEGRVVLKVSDLHHKTEQKAVYLGIEDEDSLFRSFTQLRQISDAPLLIQQQVSGHEIYLGINFDPLFGHQLFVGKGGIYLESQRDVQSSLLPVSREECLAMIQNISEYPIWAGMRGQTGVNIDRLADIIQDLVTLVESNPWITEMDINPLIADGEYFMIVDARIR